MKEVVSELDMHTDCNTVFACSVDSDFEFVLLLGWWVNNLCSDSESVHDLVSIVVHIDCFGRFDTFVTFHMDTAAVVVLVVVVDFDAVGFLGFAVVVVSVIDFVVDVDSLSHNFLLLLLLS